MTPADEPETTGGSLTACAAERERRKHAIDQGSFVVRQGDMERRICFEVGYDHMAFGCGHGRHGMGLRFVLVGPKGAVQWLAWMTNWFPGNVDQIGGVGAPEPTSLVPANQRIGDGMAVDLGFHAAQPSYEGQSATECGYLPAGECYCDGSGINAGPVLEAFLRDGPMAVWAHLGQFYASVFGPSDSGSDRDSAEDWIQP